VATIARKPITKTISLLRALGIALGAGLPTSPKPPTAGLPESGDLAVVPGAGSGDPRTTPISLQEWSGISAT
jgi:hypothetical protein